MPARPVGAAGGAAAITAGRDPTSGLPSHVEESDLISYGLIGLIGAIERFESVGDYASYARCVDSVHTSNNKKKGEGNRRNGNKYLAWAFIEAANMARRWCAEAKRFYERKKARTNAVVATKALAHKLARACYHMLKENQPFDVKRCFA